MTSNSADRKIQIAKNISQTFTREEVLRHKTKDLLNCIIDSRVYDLTEFLEDHPGGQFVLLQIGGGDATIDFYNLHRHAVLEKYAHLCTSTVVSEDPEIIQPSPGDLGCAPYAASVA